MNILSKQNLSTVVLMQMFRFLFLCLQFVADSGVMKRDLGHTCIVLFYKDNQEILITDILVNRDIAFLSSRNDCLIVIKLMSIKLFEYIFFVFKPFYLILKNYYNCDIFVCVMIMFIVCSV